MLERWNGLRQLLAAAAALVAVYMYGVAYFAVCAYYRIFGLSPTDAGVTQSTLVASAVAGFSFVFGALAVAVLAAWPTRHFVRGGSTSSRFHLRQAGAGAAGIAVIAAGYWLVSLAGMLAIATIAIGLGVFASSATSELTSTNGGFWMRAGVCALVALSWVFFIEVAFAGERLAKKATEDGGFEQISFWETATSFALGVQPVPVYRHDHDCALLVAHSGDDAWIMTSPGETVLIERVDRATVTVRYATGSAPTSTPKPRPRPCWRNN